MSTLPSSWAVLVLVSGRARCSGDSLSAQTARRAPSLRRWSLRHVSRGAPGCRAHGAHRSQLLHCLPGTSPPLPVCWQQAWLVSSSPRRSTDSSSPAFWPPPGMSAFPWLLRREPSPGAKQAGPRGYGTKASAGFYFSLFFRSASFYLVPAIAGMT